MLPLFSSWREAVWLGGWGSAAVSTLLPQAPRVVRARAAVRVRPNNLLWMFFFISVISLKIALVSCFLILGYEAAAVEPGSAKYFFIFFWLTPGEYGGRFS